jgi:hypothetical protein
MKPSPRRYLACALSWGAAALLAALLSPSAAWAAEPAAARARSSCVDCHSNPRLLVQNKKLYDYYQGWRLSIHEQEKVSCVDCHGGNPRAADKQVSHGDQGMSASIATSPISYQNVPETCAKCHKEVYNNYKQSKHFKQLTASKMEDQGPNCVTCHGSVNTAVLNVSTVRATCEKCHNDESGNKPEIPEQAEDVLSQFLSIQRYYRYLAQKGDPARVKALSKSLSPRIKQLNDSWHTFDLEKVSEQTQKLIDDLKAQRDRMEQRAAPGAGKK